MEPSVDLEEVTRRREQGPTAFVLRVPRLRVHAGEFVALVGDSGSGKSTLLDMLALVLRPTDAKRFEVRIDRGQVPTDVLALWRGARESRLAALRRQHLGYILQSGGLLPFLSVLGNLTLPLRLRGEPFDTDTVLHAARRMGLGNLLRRKPDQLSGGERQRVAVLRALLHRPSLVLADEPTAAVDKSRARAIVADLRSFARELGSAVVMVTHDLELVEGVADRGYRCILEATSPRLVEAACVPS